MGYIVWGECVDWGIEYENLAALERFASEWTKAVQRSKEVINFEQYLKITETSLNLCDHRIGIQREDRLSVDVTFSQFMEGYVVLREFLVELCCIVAMRGNQLFL